MSKLIYGLKFTYGLTYGLVKALTVPVTRKEYFALPRFTDLVNEYLCVTDLREKIYRKYDYQDTMFSAEDRKEFERLGELTSFQWEEPRCRLEGRVVEKGIGYHYKN